LVCWRPLRFRRFRGPPATQHWIQQQESAFSVALSIEAQRTLVPVREIDLHIPSADHAWSLGLSESDVQRLRELSDKDENQYRKNAEARMSNDEAMPKHPPSLGYGAAGERRRSGMAAIRHLIIRHSFELRHSDFVILLMFFGNPSFVSGQAASARFPVAACR
jgi:hypothetical protein